MGAWSQELISQGRLPFRRVETYPRLFSPVGEIRPPLVLWINRDSFMAGGIILPVAQNAEEGFALGRASSLALGLTHFVTWGPRRVEFWESGENQPRRLKTLDFAAEGTSPKNQSRWILQQVLEGLKPLAVLGAVAPEDLSPYYLANLCQGPLLITQIELEESFRGARAQAGADCTLPSNHLASCKNLLTLARLLAAMTVDQIPLGVQPEKFERALELAVPYLAPPLLQALQPFAGELPLPHSSAVRFHHLFRRLGQLRWGQNREKASQAVEILWRQHMVKLGLTSPPTHSKVDPGTLLVNPAALRPAASPFQEVHQDPAMHALLALLRDLRGLPAPSEATGNPITYQPNLPPTSIEGTILASPTLLSAAEKELFRLCLRTSWPHRRFHPAPRTPRWIWETVHLLGLAADHARIVLDLPSPALNVELGRPLIEVLTEHFTLRSLEWENQGHLSFHLEKSSAAPGAPLLTQSPSDPDDSLADTAGTPFDALEKALSSWLGEAVEILEVGGEELFCTAPGKRERQIGDAERAGIVARVFADGLPQFPEKYLYAHFRPELQEFTVSGALRIEDAFLGVWELVDGSGHKIQVEGEETAQALVLASHGANRPLRVPRDRHLTAAIVEKYLQDLQALRLALLRETHSRRERPQAARFWAKRIWESLPLPPWELIPE
ncbi:hypothetical protein L9S41_06115 [Geoalkalibacter halelectricus]|uniref:Uncharacterized protein n=1 Tax=Geoalkalibacter halelectricus TaxID=2847045 RepID=A0ABY5ZST4_9BACT|nr:hypothetical protein [Geoalkalibacter halelectricus]UWZ80965.1 hypothetical protein L9S41_06115 [Geoalkalibacter halelectricus]